MNMQKSITIGELQRKTSLFSQIKNPFTIRNERAKRNIALVIPLESHISDEQSQLLQNELEIFMQKFTNPKEKKRTFIYIPKEKQSHLSLEEINTMDKEISNEMLNGPLFPLS